MRINNEYIISVPPCESNVFSLELAGITYENPSYLIARQSAAVSVVEYVISGVGYIEIQGKRHTVSAGDMYIIPPNSKHRYYADKEMPYQKIWFNSHGILLGELMRIYSIEDKIVFRDANGYEYMKKILEICEDKKLSGNEISKRSASVLFELVGFLSSRERLYAKDSDAEKLKSYIDMNIDKKLSVSELSKQIFRSKSQTIRIFKRAYGKTPYNYLLGQRLARATVFLQNTQLPIKEIAKRVGFCDEHYFSNIYKEKTGKAPTDLRKN